MWGERKKIFQERKENGYRNKALGECWKKNFLQRKKKAKCKIALKINKNEMENKIKILPLILCLGTLDSQYRSQIKILSFFPAIGIFQFSTTTKMQSKI